MLPLALVVSFSAASEACSARSSAASSSASSTISARRCCRSLPISCCSCRWCWCCLLAPAGPVRGAESCDRPLHRRRRCDRRAHGRALPRHGSLLRQHRQPILFYRGVCARPHVRVGYAGLVSLGHADCSAWRATPSPICSPPGNGHLVAILGGLAAGLAPPPSLPRWSLRVAGISFIMITLALGEIIWGWPNRWISITNGDTASTCRRGRRRSESRSPRRAASTLRRSSSPDRGGGDGDLRAFAIGRRAARHARSAAPHGRARLRCLDGPLLGLHVLRAADRYGWHPVRLLQPVHQPAAVAPHRLAEALLMVIFRRRRDAASVRSRRGARRIVRTW